MMITARFVKKMAIFSRVTPAPERTTLTACTPLSELPTGPCGCAPNARRKYVTTHFNNSGTVRNVLIFRLCFEGFEQRELDLAAELHPVVCDAQNR